MSIVPLTSQQIAAALDAISATVARAADQTHAFVYTDDEWAAHSITWNLELAFAQLLTLAETLQLPLLRSDIARDLETASASNEGLSELISDPDGDDHLKWAGRARRHVSTLQSLFAPEPSRTVTKDLESILRAATYSITDPRVFGAPPQNESDVHLRLESVLRCVFPDLKHKPSITKPIKNFEPDTGIPTIQTLIEYKFLSSAVVAAQMADELLADTRGYTSRDWTSFVYVIYETQRFKPETEWRQFLRDCGVGPSAVVVVLSGEPLSESRRPRQRPASRPKGSAA